MASRSAGLSVCAAYASVPMLLLAFAAAGLPSAVLAQEASGVFRPDVRARYREPVVLASKDGVLEVKLRARQGRARLDTVAKPVENMLLFGYQLIRGTASDGKTAADDLYPGPTLQVYPGETLIVHLENDLSGLSIRDFFDPKYIAKGEPVPLYPDPMAVSPLNLHVHGVHVSPKGNADNVLLHIPAGMSNTYTYRIPENMPQGAYWYHSHLHGLTTAHVYYGLAGLLAIGRTDGDLPLVTQHSIPIRNMLLQYNFVFGRGGGLAQLNNPNWPQWVSTLEPPVGDELARGLYRPLLAPTNFAQATKGTRFATVWYSGPLSIENSRGRFQFIPSNLQSFTAPPGGGGADVEADDWLPDHERDVQFTVNGLFQPVIESKPGQTEIWVLANVSDMAYLSVRLTETATGRHPKIAIVGQDGNPASSVHHPVFDDGARLVIPPATRTAIAVTMPETGDLIVEMPPMDAGGGVLTSPGIVYENDGSENPPGALGTLSVRTSVISYFDGFFHFPTQVLARAVTSGERGTSVVFDVGQPLGARATFEDLSRLTPDVTRRLTMSGGFLNDLASKDDPKSFVYAFEGTAFPNVPLIQPRLGSVEEWSFVNDNNDEHPIHVHVNDFQVTSYSDPTNGLRTGVEMWEVDNANVPAPKLGPGESVIAPGTLAIRTRFEDYTGLFVMHCHRLNHEDNGLMALVNVIPAVSAYAVAVQGEAGRSARVDIYDGKDDRRIVTLVPFPGFEGSLSVAMGDVDDDGVLDLVVGAGPGHAPMVVAYAGQTDGLRPFEKELLRFAAFDEHALGGVHVAAAQIDGGTADNIIVGSGPGMASEVKVFGSALPSAVGTAPALFSSFTPYANDTSGVSVAAGFVDFATGRNSIITAPGPGIPTQVKVFSFSLMRPLRAELSAARGNQCPGPKEAAVTAAFMPFGLGYTGGASLATGWLTGSVGGAEAIVVGQLSQPGAVKVYSSGSALQGGPKSYLHSAAAHNVVPTFSSVAQFAPFEPRSGVEVATTSTTVGADLLVSGVAGGDVQVRKYQLVRQTQEASVLDVKELGEVSANTGTFANALGGD